MSAMSLTRMPTALFTRYYNTPKPQTQLKENPTFKFDPES